MNYKNITKQLAKPLLIATMLGSAYCSDKSVSTKNEMKIKLGNNELCYSTQRDINKCVSSLPTNSQPNQIQDSEHDYMLEERINRSNVDLTRSCIDNNDKTKQCVYDWVVGEEKRDCNKNLREGTRGGRNSNS